MIRIAKICVLALFIGLVISKISFADSIILKFHSFPPMPANSNSKFVKPWADKIEKDSSGRLRVEMYPSMQLGGKPPQLIDQVKDGAVDLIWTVAGYTPGRFPRLEVFDLPFMAASSKATSQAVHRFAETVGSDDLKDFKILAVHVHAPGTIHTKNTLIRSIEDLKGLKIRGPNRVISEMFGALGATPIGMPVPQVAPALSKGVIDGMVVPWEIMPPFKLQELTMAHTSVGGSRGLYTTPFLFLMNKKKYNSLSDDLKKVIDDNSGIKLAKLAGELWDSLERPAEELAIQAGGKFHELSGESVERMEEISKELRKNWINSANSSGLEGDLLYRTARELIMQYEN